MCVCVWGGGGRVGMLWGAGASVWGWEGKEEGGSGGVGGARTAPPAARTSVSLGVPLASPRTTRQKRCENVLRRYVSRGSISLVRSISCRPHEAEGKLEC